MVEPHDRLNGGGASHVVARPAAVAFRVADRPTAAPLAAAGTAAGVPLELLGAVVQESDDGVAIEDREGRLLYANDAALRLLGAAALGPWPRRADDPPPDRPEMIDEMGCPVCPDDLPGRVALRTGTDQQRMLQVRATAGGGWRWLSIRARLAPGEPGTLRRAISVVQDLTAQHRIEEDQRLLARAADLLGTSLDPGETLERAAALAVPRLGDGCLVFLLDDRGSMQAVAAAHVDWRLTPLLRAAAGRYRPPARSRRNPLVRALRTRSPEVLMSLPSGLLRAARRHPLLGASLRELRVQATLICPLVARDRVLGALMVLRSDGYGGIGAADVRLTQELARRAALAVDNARLHERTVMACLAKSNFLAAISHELRTPLTAIMGYVELLRDGHFGEVSTMQYEPLARVQESSTHLLTVIQEILSYADLEVGSERIRLEMVNLNDVVEDLASFLQPMMERKRLWCHVRLEGEPPVVPSDRAKVRQILGNLLSNAIRFTERGGMIVVVRRLEGRVRVSVEDSGIGIAAEHHDRIFEPFWQVEQTTTRRTGGTGIGLSVARQLARALGGDVLVSSAVGWGSTFALELPLDLDRESLQHGRVPGAERGRDTAEDEGGAWRRSMPSNADQGRFYGSPGLDGSASHRRFDSDHE